MEKQACWAVSAALSLFLLGCGAKSPPEAMLEAVTEGRVERVEKILTANPELADPEPGSFGGTTPLSVAAVYGHTDVAQLLLENGANANVKDARGKMALHHAVIGGHDAVVELLLANGAEVNAGDGSGLTPLHWAALRGDKESASLLLGEGADVNALDERGFSPLTLAGGKGADREELVGLLKESGAK